MRVLVFSALGFMLAAPLGSCSTGSSSPATSEWTVDAGALKMRVTASPWNMTFLDGDGNPVLVEHAGTGEGPTGSLAMHPRPAASG